MCFFNLRGLKRPKNVKNCKNASKPKVIPPIAWNFYTFVYLLQSN
jgi:hypothetical protein